MIKRLDNEKTKYKEIKDKKIAFLFPYSITLLLNIYVAKVTVQKFKLIFVAQLLLWLCLTQIHHQIKKWLYQQIVPSLYSSHYVIFLIFFYYVVSLPYSSFIIQYSHYIIYLLYSLFNMYSLYHVIFSLYNFPIISSSYYIIPLFYNLIISSHHYFVLSLFNLLIIYFSYYVVFLSYNLLII